MSQRVQGQNAQRTGNNQQAQKNAFTLDWGYDYQENFQKDYIPKKRETQDIDLPKEQNNNKMVVAGYKKKQDQVSSSDLFNQGYQQFDNPKENQQYAKPNQQLPPQYQKPVQVTQNNQQYSNNIFPQQQQDDRFVQQNLKPNDVQTTFGKRVENKNDQSKVTPTRNQGSYDLLSQNYNYFKQDSGQFDNQKKKNAQNQQSPLQQQQIQQPPLQAYDNKYKQQVLQNQNNIFPDNQPLEYSKQQQRQPNNIFPQNDVIGQPQKQSLRSNKSNQESLEGVFSYQEQQAPIAKNAAYRVNQPPGGKSNIQF